MIMLWQTKEDFRNILGTFENWAPDYSLFNEMERMD